MNNIRFEDEWDEMCPIYFKNENTFEQIGTGVLINIFENVYLLTASHVVDDLYKSKGTSLLIPTKSGFSSIHGEIYHRHLKESESRDNDKIDFSFYKLSCEMVRDLHSDFIPLVENKIDFSTDFTTELLQLKDPINYKKISKSLKEKYTQSDKISIETTDKMNDVICDITIVFAGFPNTKSKYKNDIHQSEIVYYHGRKLSSEEYNIHDYDKSINILSEHGKFGVMDSSLTSKNAAKPHGISGGGVYKIIRTDSGFDRELIGIGHTYKQQKHLFVGTNINYCINIIKDMLIQYD